MGSLEAAVENTQEEQVNVVENQESSLKKMNELQTKEDIINFADSKATPDMKRRQKRDQVYSTLLNITQAEDWELYPGDAKTNPENTAEVAAQMSAAVRQNALDLFKEFKDTQFGTLEEMLQNSNEQLN